MRLEELLFFFDKVVDRYTVDELVEVLGITVEDIVDKFEDRIIERREDLDV